MHLIRMHVRWTKESKTNWRRWQLPLPSHMLHNHWLTKRTPKASRRSHCTHDWQMQHEAAWLSPAGCAPIHSKFIYGALPHLGNRRGNFRSGVTSEAWHISLCQIWFKCLVAAIPSQFHTWPKKQGMPPPEELRFTFWTSFGCVRPSISLFQLGNKKRLFLYQLAFLHTTL